MTPICDLILAPPTTTLVTTPGPTPGPTPGSTLPPGPQSWYTYSSAVNNNIASNSAFVILF